MRFDDRKDAGTQLAEALQQRVSGREVVILALPRGGVPVAAPVAERLNAPLDVFVVRKLGVPGHEELAMGAIAAEGVRVLNKEVMVMAGVGDEDVARVAAREQQELQRRERAYRGDRPMPEIGGKTVVLVDDGLATGATMRAAVQALRAFEPEEIIVAVPVGAPSTVAKLQREADAVVCLSQPPELGGVGAWYKDFRQTSDEEVRSLLLRAGS